jgi:uncharacterized SAM-binding protein YcdF (DUF218 family)
MTAIRGVLITGAVVAVGLVVAFALAVRPYDDVPRDPDVIVVLGGAGPERTELGIELSERYGVPLVLSSSAAAFGEGLGLECGRDVRCIEPEPENTTGEARTVGELAETEGWEHVTVATARFHSTRARVLFRQCLGDRVTVVGAPKPEGDSVGPRRWVNEWAGTLAAWTFARAC